MRNSENITRALTPLVVLALVCVALVCLSGCGRARIMADPAAAALALERNVVPNQQNAEEEPQDKPEQPAEQDAGEQPQDERRNTTAQQQPGQTPQQPQQQASSATSRPQQNSTGSGKPKHNINAKKKSQDAGDGGSGGSAGSGASQGTGEKGDGSGKDGEDVDQDTRAEKDSGNDQTKRDAEKQESDDTQDLATKLSAYTRYISSKHQAVFPCQQTNVYCELVEDYQAAHAPSAENRALVAVEAVNVGEAKTDTVSAAWVRSVNPGLIVKLVDTTVLGSGVNSTSRAKDVAQGIMARDGWESVDAVQHRDVIVANAGLLGSDAGTMLFKLYLAMYIYPDAYGDLIEQGGIDYVYKDIYGTDPDGTYFYSPNGL